MGRSWNIGSSYPMLARSLSPSYPRGARGRAGPARGSVMSQGDHDFSGVYTLFVEPLWFIAKKRTDGPAAFMTVIPKTGKYAGTRCVVLCSTFEYANEFVRRVGNELTHEPVTTKSLDDFVNYLEGTLELGLSHVSVDPGLSDSRVFTIQSLLDSIRNRPK
jgi:hypothetical protein